MGPLERFLDRYKRFGTQIKFVMKSKDVKHRIKVIEKVITLFDEEKFFEANELIRKEDYDYNIGVAHEPIISLLLARSAQETIKRKQSPYLKDEDFGGDLGRFFSAFVCAYEVQQELMIEARDPKDKELQSVYMHYHLLGQFSLFHALRNFKAGNKVEDFNEYKKEWFELEYDKFNDYTGLDPFFMWLCPPHQIWEKYIYDGKVYSVKDNKLIGVPLADYDFTKDKPKLNPFE